MLPDEPLHSLLSVVYTKKLLWFMTDRSFCVKANWGKGRDSGAKTNQCQNWRWQPYLALKTTVGLVDNVLIYQAHVWISVLCCECSFLPSDPHFKPYHPFYWPKDIPWFPLSISVLSSFRLTKRHTLISTIYRSNSPPLMEVRGTNSIIRISFTSIFFRENVSLWD